MASVILAQARSESPISAYKKILSNNPHDAEAHLGLAEIYRQQGHKNRAALSYELAAQELAAQGKVHQALAAVQLIIDMSPENVARRIRLAEQYDRANMRAEAVREFSAAASYLRGKDLHEEYAWVSDRLRALQLKSSEVEGPPDDAASCGVASRQTLGEFSPGGSVSQFPGRDSAPQPASTQSEAPSLIAEADSFLRLGLVGKAIEHLAAALVRNPLLRALHEPLVTLYVAQRQYEQAVGELWQLLTHCTDRQQEIRFLRYILRLDSKDRAARQQLSLLLATHPESRVKSEEPALTLSIAAVDSELRQALGSQRPATDLAVTSVIQLSDAPLAGVPVATCSPHPPAPIESPNAVTTDQELAAGRDDADPEAASNVPVSMEIAAAMRALTASPPSPSQCTPTLTALLSGAHDVRSTIEIVPADIEEVGTSRAASPKSSGPPPPPPRAQRQMPHAVAAAEAIRRGTALRAHGDYAQAISEFEKALDDKVQGARAALLIGHCFRDQNLMTEAVAAFMKGLNMPGASEADLTELFYDLGCAHEQACDAKEAILFFQLSLGPSGGFRDAAERIIALGQSLHQT